MNKKIESLIEVRKLITFTIALVFVYKAVTNGLDANFIENVILMVLSYYFAKSTALDKQKE